MEQVFNFFARLGDVALGVFVAVCLLIIVLAAIIEIIDFLIVDPIKRSHHKAESVDEEPTDLDTHFRLDTKDN